MMSSTARPNADPGPDEHVVPAVLARIRTGRRVVKAVRFLAIVGGGYGFLSLTDVGAYVGAAIVVGLVLLVLLLAVGVEALLDGLALRLPPEA